MLIFEYNPREDKYIVKLDSIDVVLGYIKREFGNSHPFTFIPSGNVMYADEMYEIFTTINELNHA